MKKAVREHHLEVRCYKEFMEEWLTRCIEVSTAQRVRSFLDEFRRYLPMMIADSPEETYMTSPKTGSLAEFVGKRAVEKAASWNEQPTML